MSRLFIGNFDFERQLIGSQVPSPTLTRLNAELACVWLAVAEDDDVLLCPEPLPESFLDRMEKRGCPRVRTVRSLDEASRLPIAEVVPWGWTTKIRQWAQQHAAGHVESAPAAVAEVNSRSFSCRLETDLGCGLPGGGPAASLDELAQKLNDLQKIGCNHWLLKANFGQAGRERCQGEGTELDERVLRWAASRLRRDDVLFVEPYIEATAEAGLQWTIPRRETPQLDAVVLLESNADGSYRRSRVLPGTGHHRDWEEVIEIQARAVAEIQQRGYFGPVGIDAMRYRLPDGETGIRPLQDINARWTMGRLALGWARRLSPDLGGSWIHQQKMPSLDAIPTSPETLAGQPVQHRTWWVSAF